MALIPVKKIIEHFQTMYREHWKYTWGAAQKGNVDCSGSFCYVYHLFGKSITHGSNSIQRNYIVKMLPISEAKPGMAAFKRRKPGDQYYDLLDKYKQGGNAYNGDINDYYHIGLVDEDTRYVLNAQSEKTGFVRSPISQNWCGVGYLKAVDYDGESVKPIDPEPEKKDDGRKEPMATATVIKPEGVSGTKVHIRKSASTGAALVDDAPFGATVEILDSSTNSAWYKVKYKGKTGWMMRKFLSTDTDDEPATPDSGGDGGGADMGVTVSREWLERIREDLNKYLGVG